MEVVIASLTVPDLGEALRRGGSDPLLGPFLNGGSHCEVAGVAGPAEILDAARAVAAEGLPLTVLADADLQSAGEPAALCLIAVDGAGRSRPLAVLYGRGLPVLGAIPACGLADLRHTWTALAGGTPSGGRHLLHEQPEEWDPRLERQLTQRLRQLYGE